MNLLTIADDGVHSCTTARLLLLLLGGGGLGGRLGSCLLGGSFLGSRLGRGGNLSGGLSGGRLGSNLGSGLGCGFGSNLLGSGLLGSSTLGSLLLLSVNLLGGVTTERRLATLGDEGSTTLSGLEVTLLEELSIVSGLLAGLVDLEGASLVLLALVLDAAGSDQTLDADSLETFDGLSILGLGLDLLAVSLGILTDIILLAQVEELSDLAGSLGTKTAGNVLVCDSGQLSLTLLDDNQVKGREVRSDNATTDRLSLALSVTSGTVSRVSLA